jgi:RNA polymerase sigma-70 factor (ECF subfamily)
MVLVCDWADASGAMLENMLAIDLTTGARGMARVDDREAAHALFEAFVHRQSRFVFQVAYAVLRNASDAEDVVQETFLKLYRSEKWTGLDDERAFLARAAWRMAVSRRPKRHTEEPDPDTPSVAWNPEQTAIASDDESLVHRLIDSLPDELRVPLALSGIQGLNSPEIAGVMGIPEGTVRTRLQRAREMVKRKLEGLGR